MSERKIRVAIVGVGGIAEHQHIPAYKSNKNAEVVAIVDSNEKQLEKIRKKFKVEKTFATVDSLFDNMEIDAMSVCTPPDTHAEIALKGLQNGIHILCEKPMTTDILQGKRMVDVSRTNNRVLMVGFHRRFMLNYQKAKRQILTGRLGHVYCIEDNFTEPNPLYNYSKSTWFFKPGVGGVLLDIAPHLFDMFNYLFDDFPVAISAQGLTYLNHSVEDSCSFVLEYSRGRIGIGIASWLSCKFREYVNILGTAQNLQVSPNYFLLENSNEFHEISLLRAAGESLVNMKFRNLPFFRARRANPYQLEIDHFINCIRNKISSSASALNGLSVLMTTDAARRSIDEGCRVEIPSPEPQ